MQTHLQYNQTRLAILILVTLLFVGCTNAITRPTTPLDEPADPPVYPLQDYTGGKFNNGANADVVRVFLVHGMSHSDPDWADDFIQGFEKRLKLIAETQANGLDYQDYEIHLPATISLPSTIPHADPDKFVAGNLRVKTAHVGNQVYKFYALQWSPLTDPWKCTAPIVRDRDHEYQLSDKKKICNFSTPDYPVHRAWVNRATIKNPVLDDGIPDVALYMSPTYGSYLKAVVNDALCRILFDQFDGSRCLVPNKLNSEDMKSKQLFFVTHSLGSMMLLDTLSETLTNPPTTESSEVQTKLHALKIEQNLSLNAFLEALNINQRDAMFKAVKRAFERPTPFYMLANQYSLLSLAKADVLIDIPDKTTCASNEQHPWQERMKTRNHPFFKRLDILYSASKKDRQIAHIPIVGISDPNDDLSFLLPRNECEGNKDIEINDATVQNVLVNNDVEYFWIFENPLTAHLGYIHQNENLGQILDVMVCGITNRQLNTCNK